MVCGPAPGTRRPIDAKMARVACLPRARRSPTLSSPLFPPYAVHPHDRPDGGGLVFPATVHLLHIFRQPRLEKSSVHSGPAFCVRGWRGIGGARMPLWGPDGKALGPDMGTSRPLSECAISLTRFSLSRRQV